MLSETKYLLHGDNAEISEPGWLGTKFLILSSSHTQSFDEQIKPTQYTQ